MTTQVQVHPDAKMITAAIRIAMTVFCRVAAKGLHVLFPVHVVFCEVDDTGKDACIDECEQALMLGEIVSNTGQGKIDVDEETIEQCEAVFLLVENAVSVFCGVMEAGGDNAIDDDSVSTETFLQYTPLLLNVHFKQKMHLPQDNWKNDVVVQLRNLLHCTVWLLSGTLEQLAWNLKQKCLK